MGSTAPTGNQPGSKPSRAPLSRAIALVGPAGTGKTSLAEALLFASGAINRQGSVEAGTTLGDASPEARARRARTAGKAGLTAAESQAESSLVPVRGKT